MTMMMGCPERTGAGMVGIHDYAGVEISLIGVLEELGSVPL